MHMQRLIDVWRCPDKQIPLAKHRLLHPQPRLMGLGYIELHRSLFFVVTCSTLMPALDLPNRAVLSKCRSDWQDRLSETRTKR